MEQITAKEIKDWIELHHPSTPDIKISGYGIDAVVGFIQHFASLRSVSETKEPEIIKATGEALHDIQVEDKFIDRLLKEFEDNGISTENWDGDEGPEYCIVMGVLRHIENISPVPVSEVGQMEEEIDGILRIYKMGDLDRKYAVKEILGKLKDNYNHGRIM